MHVRKIFIILICLCLLCVPAAAVSITDCTVSGTNIYAGGNRFDIGPAAEIDSTSTASGITAVSGRCIQYREIRARISRIWS